MSCALIAVYMSAKLVTYINPCQVTYIQEFPNTCNIWTANGKFLTDRKTCDKVLGEYQANLLNQYLHTNGPDCHKDQAQDNGYCHDKP